jgi:mannose-6-phosphate isomerase-like protein (cupin superfamily)
MMAGSDSIASVEVVLPAGPLEDTLAFFVGTLGFRVAAISPADAPAVAVLAGHGMLLRLDRAAVGDPGRLRLRARDPARVAGGATELVAPNGTRIAIVDADPPVEVPPLVHSAPVIAHVADSAGWHVGRAGMTYRDLLPDRLGGRFIASHIRVPDGGPLADYVHFHKIRFQMIFCRKGWVKVVYEDQGEPFVMQAGDCVLQPPRIRHRVLECSPGMEVVEIACPGSHETIGDLALDLPNPVIRRTRDFGGQRFVRHVAEGAPLGAWRSPGFAARDLGIGAATDGLAGARVVTVAQPGTDGHARQCHDAEFLFVYLLSGRATLHCAGTHALVADDACAIPAGVPYALSACTPDLAFLEVTLPGMPGAVVA